MDSGKLVTTGASDVWFTCSCGREFDTGPKAVNHVQTHRIVDVDAKQCRDGSMRFDFTIEFAGEQAETECWIKPGGDIEVTIPEQFEQTSEMDEYCMEDLSREFIQAVRDLV